MKKPDNVLGLLEAARRAGVTPRTIRSWAQSGRIKRYDDDAILAEMNKSKTGRPHTAYYLANEIDRATEHLPTIWKNQTRPDALTMISQDDAANALGVTTRTIGRVRDRENMTTIYGTDQRVYLLRAEVEALKVGDDYQLANVDPEKQEEEAAKLRAQYEIDKQRIFAQHGVIYVPHV